MVYNLENVQNITYKKIFTEKIIVNYIEKSQNFKHICYNNNYIELL